MRPSYHNEHARLFIEQSHHDEAWIVNFFVDIGYRNFGYGSELMRRVIDTADRQGVTLWLTPDPHPTSMASEDLCGWYKRLGFVWATPEVMPSGLAGYMKRKPKNGAL